MIGDQRSVAVGFQIPRRGKWSEACGAGSGKAGELMDQMGLVHIILLRSHIGPFAGRLFSRGNQSSLKTGDSGQRLGQDSYPNLQQALELAPTHAASRSAITYAN